jgi:subtilase family serine protease
MTGRAAKRRHLDIHRAIQYAVQHRLGDVINYSWGAPVNVAVNQYVNQASGPSPLASGGGPSVLFPRPFYQDGAEPEAGAWRGIPDISMTGSCRGVVEIYHSFNGQAEGFPPGWNLACGTSESAPLLAGTVDGRYVVPELARLG